MAVPQTHRHALRLELDAARKPFSNGRFSDSGLAEEQHRIGPLAVAENLEHLLGLEIAAEDRGNLVLACELIQVRGEVLEKRRQLEAFLQTLLAELVVAHACREPGYEGLGLDAVAPDDGNGNALRFLENCRKQVRRLDGVAARTAGMEQRQLEEQLGGRRDPQLATRHARQHAEMFFECLQDLVGIQFHVPHHLTEHVPFNLGKRQAYVLVGQECVFPSARLFQRSIDNALG